MEAQTIAELLSARTDWYRVRLPDGTIGHVRAGDVTSARAPLSSRTLEGATLLLNEPRESAAVIDTLSGTTVRVYGRFASLLFVRADSIFGWIRQ